MRGDVLLLSTAPPAGPVTKKGEWAQCTVRPQQVGNAHRSIHSRVEPHVITEIENRSVGSMRVLANQSNCLICQRDLPVIQIAARGSQDSVLNDNPTHTVFKSVHTRFTSCALIASA